MQITISGIDIEVTKKKIKNMHLYVKAPDGKVTISAPDSFSDKTIENFALKNIDWIKAKVKKYEEQPKVNKLQYISGEKIYIWGKEYIIVLKESRNKNTFEIKDDTVMLSMKKYSTLEQKEKYVKEQFRELLKSKIEIILPKWEEITGLKCYEWRTKYMKTRWGTCNTRAKRLWFNVQLATKPIDCLEYVVLHELAHLKVSDHGIEFKKILDKYMPNWREIQKKLNS